MQGNQAVIPPVEAGSIESRIEYEYADTTLDVDGFEAHSVWVWEFDLDAYVQATGLDIGGDDPYVHQENGHILRLETDYWWSVHSDDTATLSLEQSGVRGTYSYDHYFTRCGYYDLERAPDKAAWQVVYSEQEGQPYRQRTSDEQIDHYGPHILDDPTVETGQTFVAKLHHGLVGPSVESQLHDLLVYDSPDDAVTVDTYKSRQSEQSGQTVEG